MPPPAEFSVQSGPAHIVPAWVTPPGVHALIVTRQGLRAGLADGFNLGAHVGDDPRAVAARRALLARFCAADPVWLNQLHGTQVLDLDGLASNAAIDPLSPAPRADAAVASEPGKACVIMTADCLPLLLADAQGRVVAAAHAGWRGLCAGVIENTVDALRAKIARGGTADAAEAPLRAWLGPAIGPQAYEVGANVRDSFLAEQAAFDASPQALSGTERAFAPRPEERFGPGKYLCDLYALAQLRLRRRGVSDVGGGGFCTFSQETLFYSFRRDAAPGCDTGRMATLIWRTRGPDRENA
ncbi:MAG: peptidoglycan editing factor PgeF [Candidatus Protistobacter heckmanni]|nr:peptidoglycan editing factor PgeF [Candidatus Protistobacter heckmanni]